MDEFFLKKPQRGESIIAKEMLLYVQNPRGVKG
jgi:hypothetical protein